MTSKEKNRGSWGNQFEFILSLLGYAVGLGNIWRFPYLCYRNDGGTFLIPYVVMLIFVGLPIFYLETSIGQFSSKGPTSIWHISPLFKGIGMCAVSVSLIIGLYYTVIISWALHYLIYSWTLHLPFCNCDNAWNNKTTCATTATLRDNTWFQAQFQETGLEKIDFQTPSEQFYYNHILQITDIDDPAIPIWQNLACILTCWMIIYAVLLKGVKSLGKIMYVVTIFPYILITVLLVWVCVKLDGSIDGIKYYLYGSPGKSMMDVLSNYVVWITAATQIFFSLSACGGGLIALASYNKFSHNITRDALVIPILNCLTSFYAGFVVFGTLGFLAKEKNAPIDLVAEAGPGLVFIAYPDTICEMPYPVVWSNLFFVMLLLLGFSSVFSIVEGIFVAIMDEFPSVFHTSKTTPIFLRSVGILCFFAINVLFSTNIGFHFVTIFDDTTSGFPMLLVGFMETFVVSYIYGIGKYSEDLKLMLGRKPNIAFRICWAVVTPIILLELLVFKVLDLQDSKFNGVPYPDWAQNISYGLTAFCAGWIILYMLYYIFKHSICGKQSFCSLFQPTAKWGPAAHTKISKSNTYIIDDDILSERL